MHFRNTQVQATTKFWILLMYNCYCRFIDEFDFNKYRNTFAPITNTSKITTNTIIESKKKKNKKKYQEIKEKKMKIPSTHQLRLHNYNKHTKHAYIHGHQEL